MVNFCIYEKRIYVQSEDNYMPFKKMNTCNNAAAGLYKKMAEV